MDRLRAPVGPKLEGSLPTVIRCSQSQRSFHTRKVVGRRTLETPDLVVVDRLPGRLSLRKGNVVCVVLQIEGEDELCALGKDVQRFVEAWSIYGFPDRSVRLCKGEGVSTSLS